MFIHRFFEWKRDKTAKQPYYIYFPKQPKVDISTRVKSESDMTSDLNEAIVQSENGNNLYKMAEVKTEDLTTRVKAEPLEESENDGKPEFKIETEVSNNKTFTDEAHSLEGMSVCLTHYQTTNFRLLQTERVCRRQFQI